MTTQTQMTYETSQQSEILRAFTSAMRTHQTNLRLDINQMEVIVGRIAKSNDEELVKYLPEANLSISSLRECLLTLQVLWRIFEISREDSATSRST